MPLDYSNPSVILFLKESYDKENEERIAWFMKNKEKIIARTASINNQKNYRTEDIARAYIEPLMPSLAIHNEVSMPNRLQKVPHDNPIILAPDRKKMNSEENKDSLEIYSGAIMMPVDPDVTKILEIEFPSGGRQQYLKKRHEVIPEKKYYFCETSSNIYGWRLKNSETGYPKSDFKRKAIFIQDLISRSGPHPDPPHYNKIQKFVKCVS